MRQMIALTTVVAALGVGVTSAAAAPPTAFDQGEKLCLRQGGDFLDQSPDYACQRTFGEDEVYTQHEDSQARRLCLRNGGSFEGGVNILYYICHL